MKPFLLCWLSFFSLLPLQAQEFAPIGAEWFYRTDFPTWPINPFYNQTWPVFETFTVTKDTVVAGRNCRIIEHEVTYFDLTRQFREREIVSSQGDSVFVFRNDRFHLLFDFSAQQDDTIWVFDEPFRGLFAPTDPSIPAWYNSNQGEYDQFAYRIDSVGILTFGDDSLRIQYVSDLVDFDSANRTIDYFFWGIRDLADYYSSPPIPGHIVEGIGSINRITPFGATKAIPYHVDVFPEPLGCYSDSARSYRFGGFNCDSLRGRITSVIPGKAEKIVAYPNPFSDHFIFSVPRQGNYFLRLYDASGRICLVEAFAGGGEQHRLSTAHLPAGLYLLHLTDSNGNFSVYHKISKL